MKPFLLLCCALLLAGPARAQSPASVDHSAYDRLLKKYVNAQGLVNYRGFKAEEKAFNQYLALLSKSPPAAGAGQADQLAYWINAYNAYTIRLILDHYPVQSIRDIGAGTAGGPTPWTRSFFAVGGEKMSLDHVENQILRKRFHDPRVHFALVCAALSCPRLRNEAYTGGQLERQLDEQGRDFLNTAAKNRPGKATAQLSPYFDWFKDDWTANGLSVAAWVNRYAATKMDASANVTFLNYNWKLNEQ